MSKLYKLKSWFTVSEAATRLGAAIGEPVSEADMFGLVYEGHIKLCWYARHVPAMSVAWCCDTFQQGGEFLESFYGHFGIDKEIMQRAPRLRSTKGLEESKPSARLDGPYYLELDLSGKLRDWILSMSLPNSSEKELYSIDGLFVSDIEGGLWQIMTYEDGKDFFENEDVEPFWYPGGTLPPYEELVFRREDIEAFERSLTEPVTNPNLPIDTPEFAAVIEVWEEYWADGKPGIQKDALILELEEKGFTTPSAKAIDRVSRPLHAREGRRSKKQ